MGWEPLRSIVSNRQWKLASTHLEHYPARVNVSPIETELKTTFPALKGAGKLVIVDGGMIKLKTVTSLYTGGG